MTEERGLAPRKDSWALQPQPSTDPRLRNAKDVVDTRAIEAAESSRNAPLTGSPMSIDGPADHIDSATVPHRDHGTSGSLVDSIAAVLIDFSTKAYSAANSKQREETAKRQLDAAEKQDQQNRRGNTGWITLVEQGEEDMKTAAKLHEDAKQRTKHTSQRLSIAASTAAARIVDITREKEDQRVSRLESLVTSLAESLGETKKELQTTKNMAESMSAEAAKVRTNIIDPLAYTVTSTSSNLISLAQKVESSGVADLRQAHSDLKTETGSLRADLKKVEKGLSAQIELKSAIRPELYVKHETLLRVEGTMDKKGAVLREGQNKIRSDVDALRVDIQKIKNENKVRQSKPLPDQGVLNDLANLKTGFSQLNERLSTMIQRPDFVRLSSMVESLSKQPNSNTLPVDRNTPDSLGDQDRPFTVKWTTEIDRIDKLIGGLDQARRSDHASLASDVVSCQHDIGALRDASTRTQDLINEILEDRNDKERFIGEHFERHDESISTIEADLQGFRDELRKQAPVTNEQPVTSEAFQNADSRQPNNTGSSFPQLDIAVLQTGYNWLKDEFQKTHEVVTKLQPVVRAAVESNKANGHSIRTLTQRYNNINTEEMIHAMIRQLEHIYPHASQIQASFDTVSKEINGLRENFQKVHNALGEHVNKTVSEMKQTIDNIIKNVKAQRDVLKADIDQDIKKLEEVHATIDTTLAGQKEQLEKLELREEARSAKEVKNARPRASVVDSPSARTDVSDPLAGWTKPLPGIANRIIDLDAKSDSSVDTALVQQRSKTAGTTPSTTNDIESQRKRKRDTPRESPDVMFTEERSSGPLRAKVTKKG